MYLQSDVREIVAQHTEFGNDLKSQGLLAHQTLIALRQRCYISTKFTLKSRVYIPTDTVFGLLPFSTVVKNPHRVNQRRLCVTTDV